MQNSNPTHATQRAISAMLGLAAVSSLAFARPPAFEIEWSTIDGGGSLSYGGTFVLTGTIGQPDTSALTAVTIGSEGGFWADQDAAVCPADFNADGFLDFTDFDYFVEQFELGNPVSDFNHDSFLDFTDFDAFVAAFESFC